MDQAVTVTLTACLGGLPTGDPKSVDLLVEHARRRLRAMVRRMFPRDDELHQWVDTDDVVRGAHRRLREEMVGRDAPTDLRQFIALSAAMIRRELIHFREIHASAASGAERPPPAVDAAETVAQPPGRGAIPPTLDPAPTDRARAFHHQVDRLPPDLREVVDSIWYHDLPAAEVARMLGVPDKVVHRRWREAKVHLGQFLRE
jgi:RNA polymerase sigma factor (sigma-70 family)